ncbi:DNA polymerase epsilon subunit 4 [Aphelenchoides fujianensis]|nr:DNA polymerase epsilon subunit 4 [Aphelenchoides fujianensis]
MAAVPDDTIVLDETTEPTAVPTIPDGVLPLARVKKILKLCPSVGTISADSVRLIQLCAEEYLRAFVKASQQNAVEAGRKTLQLKDLNRAIHDDWAFSLLEDTLVDWPEADGKKAANETAESTGPTNPFAPRGVAENEQNVPPSFVNLSDEEFEDADPDESLLKDTSLHLPTDPTEAGEPTPAPTREWLKPTSRSPAVLAISQEGRRRRSRTWRSRWRPSGFTSPPNERPRSGWISTLEDL